MIEIKNELKIVRDGFLRDSRKASRNPENPFNPKIDVAINLLIAT